MSNAVCSEAGAVGLISAMVDLFTSLDDGGGEEQRSDGGVARE